MVIDIHVIDLFQWVENFLPDLSVTVNLKDFVQAGPDGERAENWNDTGFGVKKLVLQLISRVIMGKSYPFSESWFTHL